MLPRFRSRSVKKIRRMKPKGGATFRYVRKVGSRGSCSVCGSKLTGEKGRAKSMKRASRAFGGVLCAKCSFEVLKLVGKIRGGHIKLDDVDLERRKFVEQMVR
jgi:ribosomal protein L34E